MSTRSMERRQVALLARLKEQVETVRACVLGRGIHRQQAVAKRARQNGKVRRNGTQLLLEEVEGPMAATGGA